MTLRVRYHLAIVPLFLGLGLANVALFLLVDRSELTWGLAEEAKGTALALAAFAGPVTPPGETPPARIVSACARIPRRDGDPAIVWFQRASAGWQAQELVRSSTTRAPAVPAGKTVERLQAHEAVGEFHPQPGEPDDETTGYAGVFAPDGSLRAIVGVSVPDTSLRAEAARVLRSSGMFVAVLALLGFCTAEGLARLARREVRRLRRTAEALGRGDYGAHGTSGRIRELNDLGTTLHTMASLLGDHRQRTRRSLLQTDVQPDSEELALAWQEACDDSCDVATPSVDLALRRVGRGHFDDFLGVRECATGWFAVVGRLSARAGLTPVERAVAAVAARDFHLGRAARWQEGNPPTREACVFPSERLELVFVPKTGGPPVPIESVRAPGSRPPSSASGRQILGTLPPGTERLAGEFLQHAPPQKLALLADELAALFAAHGGGVALLLELHPSSELSP
jgi:hypothetical protein